MLYLCCRYAFRDRMTEVVIQHLVTNEVIKIKCRDLVKKIAVYINRIAVSGIISHHDSISMCFAFVRLKFRRKYLYMNFVQTVQKTCNIKLK